MTTGSLGDGLEVLAEVLPIKETMRLIEMTARWVDPKTFRLLPIWFPEYARGDHFYKGRWSEPQLNTSRTTGIGVHKREANEHASEALTLALGLPPRKRGSNWSCCHIWGTDDPKFQKPNAIVKDPMYYSCVANMVLLPTPLKAFTDAVPIVKDMLRLCSLNLYGWHCDHDEMREAVERIRAWNAWDAYPESWPRSGDGRLPLGVMLINDEIKRRAAKRLAQIRADLSGAGTHYPREQVQRILREWNVQLSCPATD